MYIHIYIYIYKHTHTLSLSLSLSLTHTHIISQKHVLDSWRRDCCNLYCLLISSKAPHNLCISSTAAHTACACNFTEASVQFLEYFEQRLLKRLMGRRCVCTCVLICLFSLLSVLVYLVYSRL